MNSFYLKTKIIFGNNSLEYLNKIKNKNIFIISDKIMLQLNFIDKVVSLLNINNKNIFIYDDIKPDNSTNEIAEALNKFQGNFIDVIIAIGGGSVIDAAKAIIFTLIKESKIEKPYFLVIPTTSGTGSEVTSFSVVKHQEQKLVLVDNSIIPDVAILDSNLVKTVPKNVTADTGMDALVHTLEGYVSTRANDFTDALAEKNIKNIFSSLIECYNHGDNLEAREKMHNSACIAGILFTNAYLGICHSLAHAVGGLLHIPHGRANTIMLPHVIAFNADFDGSCDNLAARKYTELAHVLGLPSSNCKEGVHSLIIAIQYLSRELDMPSSITECGFLEKKLHDLLPVFIDSAVNDPCTSTNPRKVTAQDFKELFIKAF